MASTKISALPVASTLTGAETIPLVQGGTTKKVTTDQFLIKDASGNVGLGVTPNYSLTSYKGGAVANYLQVASGATGAAALNGLLVGIDSTGAGVISSQGASGNLKFWTAGVQRAAIDSAGNLGLGVTPSASWFGGSVLQQSLGSVYNNSSLGAYDVSYNSIRTASDSYVYDASGLAATRFQQRDGAYKWYTAPSGTAGNAISWTQAMTLDASGNLGVGVTPSALFRLNINGNTRISSAGAEGFEVQPGAMTYVTAYNRGTAAYTPMAVIGEYISFGTGLGTERARIDASGNLGVGTASPSAKLDVASDDATTALRVTTASNQNYQLRIGYRSASLSGEIQAIHVGTAYSDLMLQRDGGNVLVGASGNLLVGTTSNPYVNKAVINGSLSVLGPQLNVEAGTSGVTPFEFVNRVGGGFDFYVNNGGTIGARLDASGNLGLGVTPSAWVSGARAVDIGQYCGIWQDASGYPGMGFNAYQAVGTGWTYKTTGNPATRTSQTSGAFQWYIAPAGTAGNSISFTQAMTLDASGNLGIGNTAPVSKLDVLAAGGVNSLHFGATANTDSGGYLNSSGATEALLSGGANYNSYSAPNFVMLAKTTVASGVRFSNGSVNFWTDTGLTVGTTFNQSVKAIIDASGNLLVGTTTTDYTTHGLKYRVDLGTLLVTSTDSESFFAHRIGSTGMLVNLYCTGNAVGSISSNGTTVAYNTSSDARLKENISNADNGSALIDGLQVRKFDWKSDGSHQRYGFVAQELDAVYPEAVSKPADPDEMMGVDYSKLVPLLVQEIQSLRARLAAAGI